MKRENKIIFILTTMIFLFLAGITSFLGINSNNLITGNVILENSLDGQISLQHMLRSEEFNLIGDNSKLCIQIKSEDDNIFAYKIRKNGDMFKITESDKYCDGPTQEDFVITFENYKDLVNAKNLPNLKYFKFPSIENNIKLWQSRFVRVGGLIVQNEEFNNKYCKFLNKHFSENLNKWNIECNDGEKSNFIFTIVKNFWWLFLIILFIGFIAFVAFNLFKDDDETIEDNTLEQLHNYIEQSKNQGFGDYQIKNTLINSGWDERTIKLAFEKIRKHHLSSFVDRFEKVIELPFVTGEYDDDDDFEI
jgi:hypothetical protein